MEPSKLCDAMSAGPQPAADQMAAIAAAGYRSVISCRPDGEEPGQPAAAEMAAAANGAGLDFRHVPVVPGQIGDDDVAKFDAALAELPQPVFGFCKSGLRATSLWALSRCGDLGAGEVVARAKEAGYDLAPIRPRIEEKAG